MRIQFYYISVLFTIWCLTASAQNNLHRKKIAVHDTVVLDTLLILPSTVQVVHQKKRVAKSWYRIDIATGKIIASPQLLALTDSVWVQYRALDLSIPNTITSRDGAPVAWHDNDYRKRYAVSRNSYDIGLLNDSQLQKQGSYTRGISYGNQQDVVMNSSLNLQLSGKLSPNINILAAISDNNIPIQPDGNTQNIQEFDKIYIQLFNDTKKLTLGDYDIASKSGTFMRFMKKVQGGEFSGVVHETKNGNTLETSVSASIAKGQFNRMEFNGQEGVQGPYRLYGVNNESYIVVLSGTERVFIDGVKVTRGEQFDYTINYNTAEITFNPNRPISNNSRIVVEFEYSEENYSRYLVFSNSKYTHKRGAIWLNVYHQQDSKSSAIDQALSPTDKQLLNSIGDNLDLAYISTVRKVKFSDNMILYRKKTKKIAGKSYDIYEYSTNPQEAVYKIAFTLVGNNQGNYIQSNSLANGRVFEWVDPINGTPQGNYAPTRQLTPPAKQQMLTVGTTYKTNNGWLATTELALSNFDKNTYSSKDDGDNSGVAVDFNIQKNTVFTDTNKVFNSQITTHFIGDNFKAIENFRTVEFNRDWNIENIQHYGNELYIDFKNSFKNSDWGGLNYSIALLKQGNNYRGIKHIVGADYQRKRLAVNMQGGWLNTEQNTMESSFIYHYLNATYALNFAVLGIETTNEHNSFTNSESADVLDNSFANYSYKVYLQNLDSTINKYQVFYKSRTDFLPSNNSLNKATKTDEFGASLWLKKSSKNRLKIESNYRRLNIINNDITDLKPENTMLGRVEHSANIMRGLIRTSTFYQLGAGLESKKEYAYLEVNTGQGIYQWVDYNKNKVKEINEFEVAQFKDKANYIRIATNTNKYEKVYTSEFRQTFNLQLRKIKGEGRFADFISRFSNRFAYRILKKSTNRDFNLYGNPFRTAFGNEAITTATASFQNTLSYRKLKLGIDFILQNTDAKQLLLQGFEYRKQYTNALRITYQPTAESRFINRFDIGKQERDDTVYPDKNFNLSQLKNELKLFFQPSLKFQFEVRYQYQQQKNRLAEEKAINHNLGVDCQYAITDNGKISATVNYLNIDYNALDNTAIAYEMLDGFLPGNNATWSLQFNQQLSKIFQINIAYNGRKSEKSKTIHIGNVQLRAYF